MKLFDKPGCCDFNTLHFYNISRLLCGTDCKQKDSCTQKTTAAFWSHNLACGVELLGITTGHRTPQCCRFRGCLGGLIGSSKIDLYVCVGTKRHNVILAIARSIAGHTRRLRLQRTRPRDCRGESAYDQIPVYRSRQRFAIYGQRLHAR